MATLPSMIELVTVWACANWAVKAAINSAVAIVLIVRSPWCVATKKALSSSSKTSFSPTKAGRCLRQVIECLRWLSVWRFQYTGKLTLSSLLNKMNRARRDPADRCRIPIQRRFGFDYEAVPTFVETNFRRRNAPSPAMDDTNSHSLVGSGTDSAEDKVISIES